MIVKAVRRQAEQLDAQCGEIGQGGREFAILLGAGRRIVRRVQEQDEPLSFQAVARDATTATGSQVEIRTGPGREGRRFCALRCGFRRGFGHDIALLAWLCGKLSDRRVF